MTTKKPDRTAEAKRAATVVLPVSTWDLLREMALNETREMSQELDYIIRGYAGWRHGGWKVPFREEAELPSRHFDEPLPMG